MSLFGIKPRAEKALRSKLRNEIRSLLRKSTHGNAYAFVQGSEHYFNLLSEYFYLIGHTDPRDRIFAIRDLLTDCWGYLPYTRRVSDFERFLQLQLEKQAPKEGLEFGEPHSGLPELNHEERFLLVAREFEEWTYKSVGLSLRWKKREISDALMFLKCRLVQFHPQMLKATEQIQLLQISELMEAQLSAKESRKIEQTAARNFHILQFKADWLAYRCDLMDLRQQMRLTPEQTEQLKSILNESIKHRPMERPKISDSLINQISFTRLP